MGKTISQAFSITVVSTNVAPVWNAVPAPQFQENQAGSYALSSLVSDADGDALTFAAVSGFPAWLSVANSPGRLIASGTGQAAGTYANIMVSVSDGYHVVNSPMFNMIVTALPVNVAPVWNTAPAPTFQENQVGTYSLGAPTVTDADGDALTFAAVSGFPPWLTAANSPGRLVASGSGQSAGTYGNIIVSANDGRGHIVNSPAFNAVVTVPQPVNPNDFWTRLDAAASFNALPAYTLFQGPAFGGACALPNGDIFFRNAWANPHWNVFFRWSSKTLEGVDSTDIGASHNQAWIADAGRNCMWGATPVPATPGWYGTLRYDLETNVITCMWPQYRVDGNGNRFPGDLGPPFYQGIVQQSGQMDYVDGSLYGWGQFAGGSLAINIQPVLRRNLVTNFNGLTIETLFPGDGYGYPCPTQYVGTPGGIGEYPYLVSGMDSRTRQIWYVDPAFDLWINNTVMDEAGPQGWVKVPTFGTKPVPASPSSLEWRRQSCLHEARNCIVVLATNGGASLSSYTGILDLNTMMWRVGPSGDSSPIVSNIGRSVDDPIGQPAEHWHYAGQLLYDRFNQRVIALVPYSNHGTAVYELHVAGPTL